MLKTREKANCSKFKYFFKDIMTEDCKLKEISVINSYPTDGKKKVWDVT